MNALHQTEPAFDTSEKDAPTDAGPAGAARQTIEGDRSTQVFVADAASINFFTRLKGNGGINPTIHKGGIRTAIERMPELTGVSLLVVDISDSTNPVADIEALADVCEPGVAVVTTGEVNDIRLYRTLIEAGVSDYLVKPLTEKAFNDAASAAFSQESPAAALGPVARTIGFVSARGGVGGSTLALNCAAQLGASGRGKTLLLDLDMVFGSVALGLDLEPGRGLREALEAPDRMDALLLGSATVRITDQFHVLACEEDVGAGFQPTAEAVEQLLGMLKPEFKNIVVDIPRGLAVQMPSVMRTLDRIVVVSDLSLAGLRDTNRLATYFSDLSEETEPMILVNRTGQNKRAEVEVKDFGKALGRPIGLSVPEDLKAAAVLSRDARPVAEVARNSKLDKAIRELTVKLGANPDEGKKPGKKARRKKG